MSYNIQKQKTKAQIYNLCNTKNKRPSTKLKK